MKGIRMRDQHRINVLDMARQGIRELLIKVLIPAAVQKKPKFINLQNVTRRRFLISP